MEININLINEESNRLFHLDNVTLCNGDSHIYNFMLPKKITDKPVIVDFQFWHEGIGISDLAHLTRVNFSNKHKEYIQNQLVEHYYKSLLQYGITGYSWNDCFIDYRKSVASMVLIPLWQYAGFGLEYDKWIKDLNGLIYNYEYMQCDELL